MGFLLKIVEGPNKGAEIALPEGVAVTLGKSDACDIVLADSTLPAESVSLEATPTGVLADGEPLEPFYVRQIGATALAVGPADAPWGELKWPEKEKSSRGDAEMRSEEGESSRRDAGTQSEEGENLRASASPREKNKRHGCLGCLLGLVLLLCALAALGWIFRTQLKPYAEKAKPYAERIASMLHRSIGRDSPDAQGGTPVASSADDLAAIVSHYGLVLTNRAGRTVLAGDFATRAERLSATAEAYAAQPGVELDFCDRESMRTAAEDTLMLVGEKGMRIAAVTNRVLVLSGTASDLRRALEALAADLPKIRNVDVSGISLAANTAEIATEEGENAESDFGALRPLRPLRPNKKSPATALPVCGILTTPYPCLVLKNGARVMEGAPFGDSVILKIEADMVTLTNSTGRFTWKP